MLVRNEKLKAFPGTGDYNSLSSSSQSSYHCYLYYHCHFYLYCLIVILPFYLFFYSFSALLSVNSFLGIAQQKILHLFLSKHSFFACSSHPLLLMYASLTYVLLYSAFPSSKNPLFPSFPVFHKLFTLHHFSIAKSLLTMYFSPITPFHSSLHLQKFSCHFFKHDFIAFIAFTLQSCHSTYPLLHNSFPKHTLNCCALFHVKVNVSKRRLIS